MLGKPILEAMLKEFPMYSMEYWQGAIADGRVSLSGQRVNADHLLKGQDLVEHRVHRHEPPVTAQEPCIV